MLEEAPRAVEAPPGAVTRQAPEAPAQDSQLILLSARSAEALDEANERLAEHLEAHEGLALADVAWT